MRRTTKILIGLIAASCLLIVASILYGAGDVERRYNAGGKSIEGIFEEGEEEAMNTIVELNNFRVLCVDYGEKVDVNRLFSTGLIVFEQGEDSSGRMNLNSRIASQVRADYNKDTLLLRIDEWGESIHITLPVQPSYEIYNRMQEIGVAMTNLKINTMQVETCGALTLGNNEFQHLIVKRGEPKEEHEKTYFSILDNEIGSFDFSVGETPLATLLMGNNTIGNFTVRGGLSFVLAKGTYGSFEWFPIAKNYRFSMDEDSNVTSGSVQITPMDNK